MIEELIGASCLFLIATIKFIVFGIGNEFNDSAFTYVQFVVVNMYLRLAKSLKFEVITSLILWAFFGLSPHSNTSRAMGYILGEDKTDILTLNTTHPRRLLGVNETDVQDKVTEAVTWIDNNKFLLTMATIIMIIIIEMIIIFITKIVHSIKLYRSINKIRSGQNIPHRRIHQHKPSKYVDFLMKIILIGYCNISTITLSQVISVKDNSLTLDLLVLCSMAFVIGFPCFIIYTLLSNANVLYDIDFRSKYGSLYMHFTPLQNKFMIVILLKQLVYSIIININDQLTITQNSILLGVNLIFFALIAYLSPYLNKLYQIQSLLISLSMVLISGINFVFLIDSIPEKTKSIFTIIDWSIHGLSFLAIFVIQAYSWRIKKKKKQIVEKRQRKSSGDGFEMMNANQQDPDYQITSSRQLSKQLLK